MAASTVLRIASGSPATSEARLPSIIFFKDSFFNVFKAVLASSAFSAFS
jgi:hypothetical protein